jgi:hypothetical protein
MGHELMLGDFGMCGNKCASIIFCMMAFSESSKISKFTQRPSRLKCFLNLKHCYEPKSECRISYLHLQIWGMRVFLIPLLPDFGTHVLIMTLVAIVTLMNMRFYIFSSQKIYVKTFNVFGGMVTLFIVLLVICPHWSKVKIFFNVSNLEM